MRRTPFLLVLLACLLVAAYLLHDGGGEEAGAVDSEATRGENPWPAALGRPNAEAGAADEATRGRTKHDPRHDPRHDKKQRGEPVRPSDTTAEVPKPSSVAAPVDGGPSLTGSGEAPPARESEPTAAKPAARRTVHVRVLKEGLEEPLPGALVVLVDAEKQRHEAKTDEAGEAYFQDVAPRRATVDAVADGWIARWTLVVKVAAEGDTKPTVIRMQRAVVVAGTVRAAEGRGPVAGARVIAVAGGRVHESQGLSSSSRGEYATVTTDVSGGFRFRALPIGQVCTLAVLARGFRYTTHGMMPAADPESRDSLEILLEAGGRLVGRVTSAEGDPVGGAIVYVYPEDDTHLAQNPRMGRIGKPVASLRDTTAVDGSFEVIGLPFGERQAATAEAKGPQRAVLSGGIVVTAAEPTATIDLRLEGAGSLRIRVVNADGRVVSAARVSCSQGFRFMRRARTDADGVARFLDVPRGRCRIRVAGAGLVPAETVAAVEAGATTAIEVRLEPKAPGVEVRGVVVDPDGQPLPGVHVSCEKPGSGHSVKATTDDAGCFVLAGVPAGAVKISAGLKGYTRGHMDVEAPGADVRIEIGRWAKIRGRVVLPPGVGKPPFIMVVRERLEPPLGGGGSSSPFQDGTFESVLTPATRTRIEICGDTFAPWTTEVWVDHGETKDLGTIRVEPGTELAGLVVDEEGSPVEGVVVTVRLNLSVQRTATTDEGGRFRLSHLAAGVLTLILLAKGHAEQVQRFDASARHDGLRLVLSSKN